MLNQLYPPLDPCRKGFLDVGDGHRMYWEESGNPLGRPLLFVHGGPGAGTQAIFRRFFDPERWRIILFDQRGCGLSIPTASIAANTTAHLIADMEMLRRHLGVQAWHLFGGSWGSTLALAYGQAHPDRVLGFILRGVFLFRPSEIAWFLFGMGQFFPDAWQRFSHFLPEDERPDLLAAYSRRLNHPDPAIHLPAAHAWSAYEESCARLIPKPSAVQPDHNQALCLARIECHYMVNAGFLTADQLLSNVPRVSHLPCTIVQGRYDMVCPPISAVELAAKWPGARMEIIADAGHSALENGTRLALMAAADTAST